MEKKFITKEQKEKVSNRLVLNFGLILAGGLVMLYVYNFVSAGYISSVQNVLLVLGILFFAGSIAAFIFGKKKCPKLMPYAWILLGAFVVCGIVASTKFIPTFYPAHAILASLILMAVYFIVMAVYTAIYLKTHTVIIEKKKIVHKKKRK